VLFRSARPWRVKVIHATVTSPRGLIATDTLPVPARRLDQIRRVFSRPCGSRTATYTLEWYWGGPAGSPPLAQAIAATPRALTASTGVGGFGESFTYCGADHPACAAPLGTTSIRATAAIGTVRLIKLTLRARKLLINGRNRADLHVVSPKRQRWTVTR